MLDISARLNASLAERRIAPPLPGVYENVPFDVYHSWNAASNSGLSALNESAAHLKAYLEEPTDTVSLLQGRALHCAVLEPDDFFSRYGRVPEGDGRTAKIKEARAELTARLGEGHVLSASAFDAVVRARDAVLRRRDARRLLEGRHELSLVWIDEATDVVCKARLDCISPFLAGGVLSDLKKARSAEPRAFARSVMTYGYYRQFALYGTGARVHDLQFRHCVNIAVETDSPFCVQPYAMLDGAIDAGEQEVAKLLARWAKLMAIPRSEWPLGYSDDVLELTLPDWSWAQIDEDLNK